MVFEAEKTKLRPLQKQDLATVHSWRNDMDLRGLVMMHPYPVTLEHDIEWLDKMINSTDNSQIVFAIESKSDGLLAGYIHLKNINMLHRQAFLGIMIGSPEHQHKGLGSEAVNLMLKYGFEFLGLEKISLEVISKNEVALKLYVKLGFRPEGVFKKHFFFQGSYHDVTRLAILREEWLNH
jgi:diamine N-acetyltransferase